MRRLLRLWCWLRGRHVRHPWYPPGVLERRRAFHAAMDKAEAEGRVTYAQAGPGSLYSAPWVCATCRKTSTGDLVATWS